MSTFDIKKFLINEGMTRVSRDRKRLSEGHSIPVIPKGQEREGWDDAAEQAMEMLNGIDFVDTDMYQDVILNTDRSIEDLNGDLEGTTCCVVKGYDGRPVFFDLAEDMDLDWIDIASMSEEEIKNLARSIRNTPGITADDIIMDGPELNESDDHEVATRYRNITMADPKNADSTKSARNTQHGSTSHHYTGLGSANQDAEHRKEQQKQNAKLKKQMGIKTKHMSKEDWITKKLNKELGI